MFKGLFKKPENDLEIAEDGKEIVKSGTVPSVPDEMFTACPNCKNAMYNIDLKKRNYVCDKCGYHFKMAARERIAFICDGGNYEELFKGIISKNIIDFPGYDKKLEDSRQKSGEEESVICAKGTVEGNPCCIFAMESQFMMGSMGAVTGEKITRLFEYASEEKLPVIGFTLSGGARMQEGIISLMQMAKTSGAVKKHGDEGNLYVAVLCDPTTGGVTASFAMEADIILAEPGALIGFAGPRVIEQTIKQKLPEGFQRSEMLLEKGFIDAIVKRGEQKAFLGKILELHKRRDGK